MHRSTSSETKMYSSVTWKDHYVSQEACRSVLSSAPSPICLGSVSPSPYKAKEKLSQPKKRCQEPFLALGSPPLLNRLKRVPDTFSYGVARHKSPTEPRTAPNNSCSVWET